MDKIEIMDETGRVKEWIANGTGVHVWRNVALDSADCGGMSFTSGAGSTDTPPSWKLRFERTIRDASDCRFFLKGNVVKRWSDSSAGWKAAERAIDKLPKENGPEYPLHVRYAYTIERYMMTGPDRGDGRPMDVEFRIGIVQWCATVERSTEASPSSLKGV